MRDQAPIPEVLHSNCHTVSMCSNICNPNNEIQAKEKTLIKTDRVIRKERIYIKFLRERNGKQGYFLIEMIEKYGFIELIKLLIFIES